MLTLAVGTVLLAPGAMSFTDIEIAKLRAIQGIKTFRLEYEATFKYGAKPPMRVKGSIVKDGDREHDQIDAGASGVGEVLSDGKTKWWIWAPGQIYQGMWLSDVAAFDPSQSLVQAGPNSISNDFHPDTQFMFGASPAFRVTSMSIVSDRGETLRRVIAETRNDKAQVATLTQWFLPDKWILKRFEMHGTGHRGPVQATGEAKVVDLNAKIDPLEFAMTPEMVGHFEQAAAKGNSDAELSLGFMNQIGEGCAKDTAKALKWYSKAANAGNPSAMSCLGNLYDGGEDVPPNYALALKWFTKAAEAGETQAMTALGGMYLNGQGATKNLAVAAKWYRRASDAGDSDADNALARMYVSGQGVPQSYPEAFKLVRKAAEGGNVDSMVFVAQTYEAGGYGVKQSYPDAVGWFRKAIDAGSSQACGLLGFMVASGQGQERDEAGAVKFFQQGAIKGDAYCMLNLGGAYEQGHGVAIDLSKAKFWYSKAAEAGNSAARDALKRLEGR